MLVDRIKKMREKSYGERRRTTFLISFSCTAIIAFVWGTVVLPQTLTLEETESSRATTVSPFKTLTEDVGIIFGDIQVGVDELGKEFNRLWSSDAGEEQEEVMVPASSRDESSSVELPKDTFTPDVYTIESEELEGALEEEVHTNGETSIETEVELEIEG
ncbi:MAG: hypothetical protein WDZ74_02280 [Candidatus Paceibacterota bacterium]